MSFSEIQKKLFPITQQEMKKVVPMTLLLFLLCVSSCILRNLKDAVLLIGNGSGAEVIPFIKVWGMLPAATLMAWLFSRLSHRFNRETAFYIIISSFLTYYLLFAFLIYPNREALHLTQLGSFLSGVLPAGFGGFISMVVNWTESIFFIAAELWPTVIITVLFWGFTNEMNSPSEAGRFYGVLKLGSTASAFFSGYLANALIQNNINMSLPFGSTAWEQTITVQLLCVFVLSLLSIWIFWRLSSVTQTKKSPLKKKKERLSLRKSLKYVIQSPYLTCISVLVVGYVVVFNLSDVLWKDQVRQAYPNPNDFVAYMNGITSKVGLISFIAAIFCPILIEKRGWSFLAYATPCVMLFTSTGFFFFFFAGESVAPFLDSFFGMSSLTLLLGFGAIQNCLSKAAKFSLFDISKEISLAALDSDKKWSGKAAIDGIGSDLGKTGASLLYQGLLLFCGTVALSAPYVCFIVFAMLFTWIGSVRSLSKDARISNSEEKTANEEPSLSLA